MPADSIASHNTPAASVLRPRKQERSEFAIITWAREEPFPHSPARRHLRE